MSLFQHAASASSWRIDNCTVTEVQMIFTDGETNVQTETIKSGKQIVTLTERQSHTVHVPVITKNVTGLDLYSTHSVIISVHGEDCVKFGISILTQTSDETLFIHDWKLQSSYRFNCIFALRQILYLHMCTN